MMNNSTVARVRRNLKNNSNGEYLGTFESYAKLIEKYPNTIGTHKKEGILEIKQCTNESYVFIDDGINEIQMWKRSVGKWKLCISGGSGGTLDHEELINIQGGNETEHIHLTQKQVDFVNAYKGYFKTEADLLLAFPVDSPDLKGGEYAFVDSPDYGIYLFEFTPAPRKLWIRDASLNYISEKEMKDGIMVKSYGTLNPLIGDLRLKKNGHKMNFESWSGTEWQLITMIGSITTDTFNLLSNTDNSIVGINDITKDAKYHNIYRRDIYTDEKAPTHTGGEFGSFDRGMTLSVNYEDGLEIAYPKDKVIVNVQNMYNVSKGVGTHTFTFTPSSDIEFEKAEFWTSKTTRARMVIKDKLSDEIVYNSQSKLDSRDTNGTEIIDDVTKQTVGNIFASFPSVGFLYGDREYIVSMEIIEGEMLGNSDFIYFKIHGYNWNEETVATREWVQSQPFIHNQSLQETLTTGNIMSADTNIRLLGVDNSETFDITKTNVTYTNNGHIDFDANGWLFSSINLSTVTPRETSMLTINLNPTTNISPKLITFHVDSVPNKPINLPDNIFFTVTELDDRTTRIPYKYSINTEVSPMVGIFSIKLDGREIKNVSMTIMKGSTNSFPNFTDWGYMKIIKGYSGVFVNLFEKEDGKYIVNPQLVKAGSATNVYWNDVKDKPTDLLTETLLTTNQHIGIPTTSNGKGLYSKQSIDAQAERNIAKYDEKNGSVEVGDSEEAIRLNYSYLWGKRKIGSSSYEIQGNDSETLLEQSFITELTVQEDGTEITHLVLSVKKDCIISVSLDDIIMAENITCGIGRATIPIPKYKTYNGSTKVKVGISSSVTESIGGLLLPSPSPFIGYMANIFRESQILSEKDKVRKLELDGKGGAIITKGSDIYNETKLLSFDKGAVIFGSHEKPSVIASNVPITTSIIDDLQTLESTADIANLTGNEFVFNIPNSQFSGYYIQSVNFHIEKPTRVECIVGGISIGDSRIFRQTGDITLKPNAYIQTSEDISVILRTLDSNDSLIGSFNEETNVSIPRVTITIIKTKNSEVCDKDFARNILLFGGDNIVVKGNLTGYDIPYDLNALSFSAPPTKPNPFIDIDSRTDKQCIVFGENFNILKDESLAVSMNSLNPLHQKSRIQIFFDIWQNNGFVKTIKVNPKTISVTSAMGNELKPEFSSNEGFNNYQCSVYVDFVKDDIINISFGEGNDFSNCYSLFTIIETIYNEGAFFEQPMFDSEGRIFKSLMSSEYASLSQLRDVAEDSRIIKAYDGDNISILTNVDSLKMTTPKLMSFREDFVRYSVSDIALYDVPTVGSFDKKYSTKYGVKSNITTGGFIQTRIAEFGDVNIPLDRKSTIIYSLYNSTKAPTINLDTIDLRIDDNSIIPSTKTINVDGFNVHIEFATDMLSNPISIRFGNGNDLSDSDGLAYVSVLRQDTISTPLLGDDHKINPSLYTSGGWDKHLSLVKHENISLTVSGDVSQMYGGNFLKSGAWESDVEQNVGKPFTIVGQYPLINELYVNLYSTDDPLPTNYTDNESFWKLKITKDLETKWIPITCTTGRPKEITNIKFKGYEISPQEWTWQLVCMPVHSEFGYSPNNNFSLELGFTNSMEKLLFNGSQKIDPFFIDNTDTNARFNEVELYSVPNQLDTRKPIYPSITFDSGGVGSVNLLSASIDKAVETNVSSYLSETNLYASRGDGLQIKWLGSQFSIDLAEAVDQTPISGTTWKTTFDNPSNVNDTLIGLETFGIGAIKLNLKVREVSTGTTLVDRDYSVVGGITEPSEIMLLITQTDADAVNIGVGEHEVILTRLSDEGTLYGTTFPASRMCLSTCYKDSLIRKGTIESQVKHQTSNAYFIISEVEPFGVITGFNDSLPQEFQSDIITIPLKNNNYQPIVGIAPNVFTSDRFNMREIVVEANFDNVHPSNFRNSEGVQCCKLICSPNNPSYSHLTELGYTVDCGGNIPSPNMPNAHLTTDSNGIMGWSTTGSNVGDVYLSSTMRIKAVGTDFLFECKVSENWVQVGKMGL